MAEEQEQSHASELRLPTTATMTLQLVRRLAQPAIWAEYFALRSRPLVVGDFGAQLTGRLSRVGASTAMAQRLSERFVPAEHTPPGIDLTLSASGQPQQLLGVARWAAPPWNAAPNAQPQTTAVAEQRFGHLAAAGWGQPIAQDSSAPDPLHRSADRPVAAVPAPSGPSRPAPPATPASVSPIPALPTQAGSSAQPQRDNLPAEAGAAAQLHSGDLPTVQPARSVQVPSTAEVPPSPALRPHGELLLAVPRVYRAAAAQESIPPATVAPAGTAAASTPLQRSTAAEAQATATPAGHAPQPSLSPPAGAQAAPSTPDPPAGNLVAPPAFEPPAGARADLPVPEPTAIEQAASLRVEPVPAPSLLSRSATLPARDLSTDASPPELGTPAALTEEGGSGDLTLVRPTALRPTALLRPLPPDPLARLGITPLAPGAPPRISAPAALSSPPQLPAMVARSAGNQPPVAGTAGLPDTPLAPGQPVRRRGSGTPIPGAATSLVYRAVVGEPLAATDYPAATGELADGAAFAVPGEGAVLPEAPPALALILQRYSATLTDAESPGPSLQSGQYPAARDAFEAVRASIGPEQAASTLPLLQRSLVTGGLATQVGATALLQRLATLHTGPSPAPEAASTAMSFGLADRVGSEQELALAPGSSPGLLRTEPGLQPTLQQAAATPSNAAPPYSGAALVLDLALPTAGAIQRAGAEAAAPSNPPQATATEIAPTPGQNQGTANIEVIAQKVYDHLRRRLLIDHERRGRPW